MTHRPWAARRGAGLPGVLLLAAAGIVAASGPVRGQARGCTLVLEPATDSTRSVRIEVAPDQYVTHVGGGLRWTCGSARMEADSAVRRPADGRLRMIGSVDYRDSLRTLLADTVVYIERQDRIVAEGRVRLTRLASGSTLEAPRVEFLRGPGGELRRTVAVGPRGGAPPPDPVPRDTAPGTRGDSAGTGGACYEVQVGAFGEGENAEQMLTRLREDGEPAYLEPGPRDLTRVVAGPYPDRPAAREARSRYGGVLRPCPGEDRESAGRPDRPRMTIPPDSAAADTAAATRVTADSIVLRGESEARTWGEVRIRRPDLEARADSAFFRMDEGEGQLFGSPEVEGEAWTLTGGRIDTRFGEGELRDVEAVEDARARGEDFRLFASRIRGRLADREIERLWASGDGRSVAFSPPYRLTGDSLAFRFTGGRIRELRSLGRAEAVEVGDSLPGDPTAEIPLTAGRRSWVSADTLQLTFGAPGDSAGAGEPGEGPLAADRVPGEGRRPGPESGDPGAAGEIPPVESLRPAGAPGDSLERGAVAAADTGRDRRTDDRALRRMRATGGARAYYLLEPEEEGGRRPRHYQRGREIVIHFVAGTAHRIEGRAAVGVHLDPGTGEGPPPPGSGGP